MAAQEEVHHTADSFVFSRDGQVFTQQQLAEIASQGDIHGCPFILSASFSGQGTMDQYIERYWQSTPQGIRQEYLDAFMQQEYIAKRAYFVDEQYELVETFVRTGNPTDAFRTHEGQAADMQFPGNGVLVRMPTGVPGSSQNPIVIDEVEQYDESVAQDEEEQAALAPLELPQATQEEYTGDDDDPFSPNFYAKRFKKN